MLISKKALKAPLLLLSEYVGVMAHLKTLSRPTVFADVLSYIADTAARDDTTQYCKFEGSNFAVHPDGTLESSHRMPPIRDGIEDLMREFLTEWKAKLSS